MPKIAYKDLKLKPVTRNTIAKANEIINEYRTKGFVLTLRQLYYQFVARGLISNSLQSYKRLGNAVDDGRLAGLIDWHAIVDRTRSLRRQSTWDSPADIIQSAESSFAIDKWKGQPTHVEVWIEKDALVDVAGRVCNEYQVSYFSCRGYTSQSAMWEAAQRLSKYEHSVVIHLGDHDPSGLDMTRDIRERLNLFMYAGSLDVNRIALNMDQVRQYNPPPNPAKESDSRAKWYIEQYGEESWELDALEPEVIVGLVRQEILEHLDEGLWDAQVERESKLRGQLTGCRKRWPEVVKMLTKGE